MLRCHTHTHTHTHIIPYGPRLSFRFPASISHAPRTLRVHHSKSQAAIKPPTVMPLFAAECEQARPNDELAPLMQQAHPSSSAATRPAVLRGSQRCERRRQGETVWVGAASPGANYGKGCLPRSPPNFDASRALKNNATE